MPHCNIFCELACWRLIQENKEAQNRERGREGREIGRGERRGDLLQEHLSNMETFRHLVLTDFYLYFPLLQFLVASILAVEHT